VPRLSVLQEILVIKTFKAKIWDLLKEKEVSLALLYDREGRILWHKGRSLVGKTIAEGEGFCKSYIHQSLENGGGIHQEDVVVASTQDELSRSAQRLFVRSVVIQPIDKDFFLYIDSGTKKYFNELERELFKMLGELLGETIRNIKKSEQSVDGISGNSRLIQNIRKLVLNYSLEDDPVLLVGETGVGKSHIAELIHKYSGRTGKFVVVDVPTINENLFESEIFGHKRGSFTGAMADKKGLVAEAEEGTLFLDEISEVPVSFQAKLLRLIETRKYRVLGETVEREADVRIVAATNRNLAEAIDKKEFREDLYYRLNVLGIEIPPLRQRREDIEVIVKENQKYLKGKEVGEGFWQTVTRHDWPGNFRELFSVLKRAGIMADSPLTGKDIQAIIDEQRRDRQVKKGDERMEQVRRELDEGKNFWAVVWERFINRDLNRDEVREILEEAYGRCGSKLKNLAEMLHVEEADVKKFVAILHKYDIHPAHSSTGTRAYRSFRGIGSPR
jgi:transcriptional regulator with PAS, ATPase and Fis domain